VITTLILLACGGDDPAHFDSVPYDSDTYVDWPDDTGETGTDADDDGWTVEEGDCDDGDIMVNPARDEDPSDGKDNDCDGRVDELFSGVAMVMLAEDGSASSIETVDALGRRTSTVALDDPALVPFFFSQGIGGEGWAIVDLAGLSLVEVDADGNTAKLAEWPEAEFGVVYGLATHPDGYYLVTLGNELLRVDGDGTTTSLATWDGEAEMFSLDVAVNVETGAIGVFGIYGGFGILDDDGTWTMMAVGNFEAPEYIMYSGVHRDNGGWYGGGQDIDGWGIFKWSDELATWSRKATWTQDWSPHFMTMDGDSGDIYMTTEGGQYPYVWRILADGTEAGTYYPEPGTHQPDVAIWDIATLYE
jgi:hypothetical protein